MQFASNITHLRPEGAYVVLARANELEAQGRDIIHLEIGQPDFDTYANVSLAGIRAIANGKTGYNPSAGIPPLREALAEDAGTRRGTSFEPAQVVVGPGAKPFLFMPLLALLEPGDEVIYPDPGFPTYEAAISVARGVPVPIPLDAEAGFDLDLNAFDDAISDKTKLVILCSPGNPTGGIYSEETLKHVADAAFKHDFWVLSDEVYSRLVYGENDADEVYAPSITVLPGMMERTILLDGFSKTYAMTGWRLGYGIMPVPLAEKVSLLLNHSIGCTATFTQYAGVEAILGPQDRVAQVRAEFRRRRDVIVDGLNAIPGIRCHLPRGAFYVFPNVEAFERPARKLASYLLDKAGVALLPGTDFGQNGEGHIRLSYASSIENIREALDRMRDALEALT